VGTKLLWPLVAVRLIVCNSEVELIVWKDSSLMCQVGCNMLTHAVTLRADCDVCRLLASVGL